MFSLKLYLLHNLSVENRKTDEGSFKIFWFETLIVARNNDSFVQNRKSDEGS